MNSRGPDEEVKLRVCVSNCMPVIRAQDKQRGVSVALLVGALLALSVGLWASGVGLDRDRAFIRS